MVEDVWRRYLTTDHPRLRQRTPPAPLLPPAARSAALQELLAPLQGAGSTIVRFFYHKEPSRLNPQLCNFCDVFASRFPIGAEVELSLLFTDVCGSTTLAEGMSPMGYSKLINRFYNTATQIMVRSNALIDKIIGDQVAALYVPDFVSQAHAARAPGLQRYGRC